MPHVRLAGDRTGEYVITEEREDGSLVLIPDTSAETILRRLGHRRGSLEELETEHGPLAPPDGEG